MLDSWLDFSQLKTYILSTSVTDDRIVPPTLSSLWFLGWDLGCWVCFGYFDLLVCFWHCQPPCRGLFQVEKKVNSHQWSWNPSLSTFKQINSHKASVPMYTFNTGKLRLKKVPLRFQGHLQWTKPSFHYWCIRCLWTGLFNEWDLHRLCVSCRFDKQVF